MSSRPKLPLLPAHALRDADEDDESGICTRPRQLFADMCAPRAPAPHSRPAPVTHLSGRTGRIEQKVRIARELIDHLPAADPHARLLRIAVLRRDEVLLDGVFTELQGRDLTSA